MRSEMRTTPSLSSLIRRNSCAAACAILSLLSGSARAEFLTQNFDDGFPETGPPLFAPFTTNFEGWVGSQIHNWTFFEFQSTPNALWLLNDGSNPDSYIRTPLLSNGIGRLSFAAKNRDEPTIDFQVQTSPDNVAWSTNALLTSSNNASFVSFDIDIDTFEPLYVRIKKTEATSANKWLGIDGITTEDPSQIVQLSPPRQIPETPVLNDPVHIEIDATLSSLVSNLAMTNFYRIGTSGIFTAIGMVTNDSATEFITSVPIPGQAVGTLVQYYIQATFDGFEALSPTNSPAAGPAAPHAYSVAERPFETGRQSVKLIDDFTEDMHLINDFVWEGFEKSTHAPGAAFRILGILTNSLATNTWGDANQVFSNFVPRGIADEGASAILVADEIDEQAVVIFNETNLVYEARLAVLQDFSTWPPQGSFGSTTHQGWEAEDAKIQDLGPGQQVRGQSVILNSSSNSYIRSDALPEGVGTITFWYRNSGGGTPPTQFYVQKSETGGSSPTEWATIGALTPITVTNFLPYTLEFNTRYGNYVRVLNSTNVGQQAELQIDEVVIRYPGAGIVASNLTISPAAPTATNTVDVTVDVDARAGASNLVVTLYYRDLGGDFQPISMTNGPGDTYGSVSAIPAAQGNDTDGTGPVDFYISVAFAGFESDLASPTFFPEKGSNAPSAFTNDPATIVLSNPVRNPQTPTTKTETSFGIDAALSGGASSLSGLLFWRAGNSGSFSTIAMTGETHLATVSALPVFPVPGQRVEYYYEISFTGPDAATPTNFPVAGAATPLHFVVRKQIDTTYTNMIVTGSFNDDLIAVQDNLWLGVETIAGSVSSGTFHFASGTNTWGDADPSVLTMPVHGAADFGAADIQVNGTETGHIAFILDEPSMDYSAERADYENFDNWPASATFGNRTNSEGWIMFDGRTTAGFASDLSRKYADGGESLVLREGTLGEMSYLQSPILANGFGSIHLLYRAWETNGFELGESLFHVQKSTNGIDGWITIATISNILSVDYCYYSTNLTDLNLRAIRILNDTNADHEALLLDEVVITEPSSGVVFSNLVQTPSSPTITNEVAVSVDIYARTGASNIAATLLFRSGTSSVFDRVAMTPAGNTWSATIPRLPDGTAQYFFEATYDGFHATPAVFPAFGADGPFSYSVSNVFAGFENFDTGFPETSEPLFLPFTTNYQGWLASEVHNWTFFGFTSAPNAMWLLNDGSSPDSYLRTPFLPFGVGAIEFRVKNRDADSIDYEVQVSSDGLAWGTAAALTSTNKDSFSKVTVILNTNSAVFLRIIKTEATAVNKWMGIDDVKIYFPPSTIDFALNMIHPGYPSSSDTVRVSCYVTNTSSFLPAANIDPSIYYRVRERFQPNFGAWQGPISTSREGFGSGARFITSGTIPRTSTEYDVQYYVRADFAGYSGIDRNNHSPSYFPTGIEITNDSFYAAPPAGFQYKVRRFQSDYGTYKTVLNAGLVEMTLLKDRLWQGADFLDESPVITFRFEGSGEYTNGANGYLPGTVLTGDNDHYRNKLPLRAIGAEDHSNIVVTAPVGTNFNGKVLFRFDEATRLYTVQRALFQDFETFQVTGDDNYVRIFDDGEKPFQPNFDNWALNETFSSVQTFNTTSYPTFYATNGAFGNSLWGIYNSRRSSGELHMETNPDNGTGVNLRYAVRVRSAAEISPFSGVGTISFTYRNQKPTAVLTNQPSALAVHTIPTNLPLSYLSPINWDPPVLSITNIPANSTLSGSVDVNSGFSKHALIFHGNSSTQSLLLDDLTLTSWYADTKTMNEWTAAESWITDEYNFGFGNGISTGRGHSCEFDATRDDSENSTNQFLVGPQMSNGVSSVSFQYLRGDSNPVSFKLEWRNANQPDAWQEFSPPISKTFSGTVGQWQLATYTLNQISNMFIRILHTSGSEGRLFLDDIQFAQVPAGNTWQGDNLAVVDVPSDPARAFRGSTGNLNNGFTNPGSPPPLEPKPVLQSPPLAPPIGEVSFWYKEHTDGGAPAKLSIELSQDSFSWVQLAAFNATTSGEFKYFSTSFYETAYQYVRIVNDITAGDRVALDDIVIAQPIASEIVTSNLTISPVAPLDEDDVHVSVILRDLFDDPSNIVVQLIYFDGTNKWDFTTSGLETNKWQQFEGATHSMSLIATNEDGRSFTYKTDTPIPNMPLDTVVQYFVQVTWDGDHSDVTSPAREKTFENPAWYTPIDLNTEIGAGSNDIPYYIVLSAPPGAVWINEVNARELISSEAKQFVELAGWAGTDINNWTLEFFDNTFSQTAQYTITSNAVLAGVNNSHGFWLIGGAIATPQDQALTNSIPYGGGVRLKRTFGIIESAVCFDETQPGVQDLVDEGFTYIGADAQFAFDQSLSAVGTNNYFTNFTWTSQAKTEHTNNIGQEFTTPPFNNPFILVISPYGLTDPPVGSSFFFPGTILTGLVENSPITFVGQTQYIASGWTGAGSVPATGSGTNTGGFTFTNDSTLTWLWMTNFFLDLAVSGSGTLDQTNAFLPSGSNVTVLASPGGGYTFDTWSGPGVPPGSESNNPIVVAMDQVRMVVANFSSAAPALGSNDVRIIRISLDSNVWISATGTNGWVPTPFMSTNIADTNSWSAVTNYQYTFSNGLFDVWFPYDPALDPLFFYINVTN